MIFQKYIQPLGPLCKVKIFCVTLPLNTADVFKNKLYFLNVLDINMDIKMKWVKIFKSWRDSWTKSPSSPVVSGWVTFFRLDHDLYTVTFFAKAIFKINWLLSIPWDLMVCSSCSSSLISILVLVAFKFQWHFFNVFDMHSSRSPIYLNIPNSIFEYW